MGPSLVVEEPSFWCGLGAADQGCELAAEGVVQTQVHQPTLLFVT